MSVPNANGKPLGISDLHVSCAENRPIVENMCPESKTDWLR